MALMFIFSEKAKHLKKKYFADVKSKWEIFSNIVALEMLKFKNKLQNPEQF